MTPKFFLSVLLGASVIFAVSPALSQHLEYECSARDRECNPIDPHPEPYIHQVPEQECNDCYSDCDTCNDDSCDSGCNEQPCGSCEPDIGYPHPTPMPHPPTSDCSPHPHQDCSPPPHPPSSSCSGQPSGCSPQPHIYSNHARGQFICDESGHIPTTFFVSQEGTLPVIHWVSHYFAQSGYDPLVRCRDVSNRFQRFYDVGVLNYVTTGIVNHQPVVCVTDERGGPCQGVLFTLRPDENASHIVQQLFDISYASSGPLFQSGSRVYLDINEFLNFDINESRNPQSSDF